MNRNDIGNNVLSWKAALARGYEPGLYAYVGSEIPIGNYTAVLDFKIWARKIMGISCYFTEVLTKKKFQLTVYCNHGTASYKISGCTMDFVRCPTDCLYQINVSLDPKGKSKLLQATLK